MNTGKYIENWPTISLRNSIDDISELRNAIVNFSKDLNDEGREIVIASNYERYSIEGFLQYAKTLFAEKWYVSQLQTNTVWNDAKDEFKINATFSGDRIEGYADYVRSMPLD